MSEFVMVKRELLERCIEANDEPQPSQLYADLRAVLAQEAGRQDHNIEAAAETLAACMDYPWEHMPENGRALMRKHAQSIIDAALNPKPEAASHED